MLVTKHSRIGQSFMQSEHPRSINMSTVISESSFPLLKALFVLETAITEATWEVVGATRRLRRANKTSIVSYRFRLNERMRTFRKYFENLM